MKFDDSIFNIIELLHKKAPFKMVFNLVSLIHNVLNSSSIYIRHIAVVSKEDLNYPLSYEQALKKHELFKSLKSSNPKTKLTGFICYPRIGRFYQMEITFNKNFSFFKINNYFDTSIFISCTWNAWLLNSCSRKTFEDLIENEQLKLDLFKLIILILPNQFDLNRHFFSDDLKKTKISDRFSEWSSLKKEAKKLNI